MEKVLVSGITYRQARCSNYHSRCPRCTGNVASIFSPIADSKINVDMIVQGRGAFSARPMFPSRCRAGIIRRLSKSARKWRRRSVPAKVHSNPQMAKISVDRRGHAEPQRRRQTHVRDHGAGEYQSQDDQHIRNQDLRCDRRKIHGIGCEGPPRRLFNSIKNPMGSSPLPKKSRRRRTLCNPSKSTTRH